MAEGEDLLDAQKEQFLANGEAPNVLTANENAWQALESCLGRDPLTAWSLTKIVCSYKSRGQVEWSATFTRDPDVEVPPMTADEAFRDVSDEEVQQAKEGRG